MTSSIVNYSSANAIRLHSGAEECIAAMHLTAAEQARVRDCVKRYSQPHSFCECLNMLMTIVSDAFLELIGKDSEWNSTQMMIQDRFFESAVERGYAQRNPEDTPHRIVAKLFRKCAKINAQKHLELCLVAHDTQAPSSDELRAQLQTIDYFNFVRLESNRILSQIA